MMYSKPVDKGQGIQYDQTGKLENYCTKKEYPEKLCRKKYYDQKTNTKLVFLSNKISLPAIEIAVLYKKLWEIELLFKWIKQHLRITSLWVITLHALKIQIYCAIIVYHFVSIIGNKMKIQHLIYKIL